MLVIRQSLTMFINDPLHTFVLNLHMFWGSRTFAHVVVASIILRVAFKPFVCEEYISGSSAP